jgi:hypothetical protein
MRRVQWVLAVVVATAVVASGEPAVADDGETGGGATAGCALGPGGATGDTGYGSPFTAAPGLAVVNLAEHVQPIDVDATIAPGLGETFSPIHLKRVRPVPTAKVLLSPGSGSLDNQHAVMRWELTVDQRCPDTNQVAECTYTYHEMPDGSIWEVTRLPDGTPIEHAFHVVCVGVRAFTAGPVDRGERLVAAARSQLGTAELEASADAARLRLLSQVLGFPIPAMPDSEQGMLQLLAAAPFVGAGIPVSLILGGTCGLALAAQLIAELQVWKVITRISAVAPPVRPGLLMGAYAVKLLSTVAFSIGVGACVAAIDAALATTPVTLLNYGLVALWSLFLGLHSAVFLVSAFALSECVLLVVFGVAPPVGLC